jgi:nucleotide-binding universal stress UspA family protein
MHAFKRPTVGYGPTWDEATLDQYGIPEDTLDFLRTSTRQQFDEFVTKHTPDDVPTTSEFVEDDPVDAVLARQPDCELIVMGTQGRGKISAALLGSVTQSVLHKCTRSVLAVPHSADLQQRGEQVVDSFHVTA